MSRDLREQVARALGLTHRATELVDVAIALIRPAVLEELRNELFARSFNDPGRFGACVSLSQVNEAIRRLATDAREKEGE